jgi:hypothetical protein
LPLIHLPTSRYPQVIHSCGKRRGNSVAMTPSTYSRGIIGPGTTPLSLINNVHNAVNNGLIGSAHGSVALSWPAVIHKGWQNVLLIHLRTPLSPQVIHSCGEGGSSWRFCTALGAAGRGGADELQACKLPTMWISAVENTDAPDTSGVGGIRTSVAIRRARASRVPSSRR